MFPGSPPFRAIIPRMTFDPPEGKAEGEPGNEARVSLPYAHSSVQLS